MLKICNIHLLLFITNLIDAVENFMPDTLSSVFNSSSLINELSKFDVDEVREQLKQGDLNEDKYLNITQLITKYGYKVETHQIVTADGYIMPIYRIPGDREPVLLMHGILSSGVDWITAGGGRALPYLLSDRNYDVWIGYARGSDKSARRHVTLSAEKNPEEYWDFTWNEIGRNDLPAMIDCILNKTRSSKLKYVGHSQGNTAFFVLCSKKPEYNNKISLMVALSPVAWMNHLKSPLVRLFSPAAGLLDLVINDLAGVYDFRPDNPAVKLITKGLCGNTVIATLLCANGMFTVLGFSYSQLDVPNLPVIFAHTPGGVSLRQIVHYSQEVVSAKFRNFDYGTIKNLQKYNSIVPPDYPVEKISAPIALFYSKNDWFSAVEDVNILKKRLPNVIDFYRVPEDSFCHSDYLWAKDVKELVYYRILDLFENKI